MLACQRPEAEAEVGQSVSITKIRARRDLIEPIRKAYKVEGQTHTGKWQVLYR